MSRTPKDPTGPPPPGRLPDRARSFPSPSPTQEPTVYVRAPDNTTVRPARRWPWFVLGLLAVVAVGAVVIMVAWPRLNPRKLDAVETVADAYLKALSGDEPATANRFGVVEEPPAIRSISAFQRDRTHDQTIKGSFAPLGKLHKQIEADFVYDASIGRFSPKNAMGPAAETLDALHKAKDDAEKSGLYKKMKSGNPDDLFDAAEEYGKVFTKLAEGVLSPKKILPTYQMLIESAKPPLPNDARSLALEAADTMPVWNALLKRSFLTLKADGPFIFERARVNAMAADRLASLGDPPSRIRLELVRFRLEGIDTGWKVVSARRVLPGEVEPKAKPAKKQTKPPQESKTESDSPGEMKRSPGDTPETR
jgi:hypothetical protein